MMFLDQLRRFGRGAVEEGLWKKVWKRKGVGRHQLKKVIRSFTFDKS